jgi:hypothetical protein
MGDLRLANQLRAELSQRAFAYAENHGLPVVGSRGYPPVALFEPNCTRHGNFLTTSYTAILRRKGWQARLAKVHTSTRDLPSCDRGTWCELDSSCSSDALLMNIFCAPQTLRSPAVLRTLGLHEKAQPEFGFSPRVPLVRGYGDTTEVDMRLGDLLVEAKLTESDFQRAPRSRLDGYVDFREVFNRTALPHSRTHYAGYQLVRNILAAHQLGLRFCLMHDARRPDLREDYYSVLRAIRQPELSARCSVLTWQELAAVLPPALQRFLSEKYGIAPAD